MPRKNIEELRAYARKYYKEHKAQQDAAQRKRLEANPAKAKAWRDEYYIKNREKVLESGKRYRTNNKEKFRAAGRRWVKNNPARRKTLDLNWRIRNIYKSTPEEVNKILLSQNNSCAICKTSFNEIKTCVDHCHKKEKIRGILCNKCNLGLGLFKDDPLLLKLAASYIESHP